jgi:hypothetical protein
MIIFAVTALLVAGILGGYGTLQKASAATAPNLGAAAPFAVLAETGISDVPTSTITGNVGLSPTTGAAITGLGCNELTGASQVYTVLAAGPAPCSTINGGLLTTAVSNMAAAYGVAAGTASTGSTGANLGGQILVPGVYTGTTVQLTGALTLNGPGVYIFQATTLTTASGSSVVLENGAQACNVFWTSSAISAGSTTIGSGTSLQGTILSAAGVTLLSGATIAGSVFAQSAVTMNTNTIAVTPCAVVTTSTTTTTSTASTSTTSGAPYIGPQCNSGVYSGYYTVSGQTVTFTDLSYATALSLVTNNSPGEMSCAMVITPSSCASPASPVLLTVDAETTTGAPLTGYEALFNCTGIVTTQTGFTPATFIVIPGVTHTVAVVDYGCYTFNHWADTGSTLRYRAFTITAATTFTAVYSNTCTPLPATSSNISVNAVDTSGNAVTGLYTTLWQNGALLQSCFGPCTLTVSNGQTYQVMVENFGNYVFSNWTDGTTAAAHTVTIGSTSTTVDLTAVFT